MREIKFRAWGGGGMYNNIVVDGDMWTDNIVEDRWYTGNIMQYTGLKDKNGKEIYEGDILQLFYPRNYGFAGIQKEEKIVTIEFQSGCFWFKGDGVTDCNWHFYNSEDRKVIGNIYEHANLLAV